MDFGVWLILISSIDRNHSLLLQLFIHASVRCSWASLEFSNLVTTMSSQLFVAASFDAHYRRDMIILQLNWPFKFKSKTQFTFRVNIFAHKPVTTSHTDLHVLSCNFFDDDGNSLHQTQRMKQRITSCAVDHYWVRSLVLPLCSFITALRIYLISRTQTSFGCH